MQAIDKVHRRFERTALSSPARFKQTWKMRQEHLSARYHRTQRCDSRLSRTKMKKAEENLIFSNPARPNRSMPLAHTGVSASFSPADDFWELRISIDQVVKNEEATYARAGQSIRGAGLDDGDLLVIDRTKNPRTTPLPCVLSTANLP